MIIKQIRFPLGQINFLENLNDLTFNEHVRRAVSDYVSKLKNTNVSVSLSKERDANG